MKYIFCWYDKVDNTYIEGTVRIHKSKRSMCRGFLTEFEQNKKMNPAEFDLVVLGEFYEEVAENTPPIVRIYDTPEVLNPNIVFASSDETDS